jgi:hypothetical protein
MTQVMKSISTNFAGLPDGRFSYQSSHFGHILGRLGMENVGTFLSIFGLFCGHLEYFIPCATVAWNQFLYCSVSKYLVYLHMYIGLTSVHRLCSVTFLSTAANSVFTDRQKCCQSNQPFFSAYTNLANFGDYLMSS